MLSSIFKPFLTENKLTYIALLFYNVLMIINHFPSFMLSFCLCHLMRFVSRSFHCTFSKTFSGLNLAFLATWRLNLLFLSAPLRLNSLSFLCLCGEECIATTAAADTNCTAANYSLTSAALVPFQRHSPSRPPPQNVNSAVTREHPACHFSGESAQMSHFKHRSELNLATWRFNSHVFLCVLCASVVKSSLSFLCSLGALGDLHGISRSSLCASAVKMIL